VRWRGGRERTIGQSGGASMLPGMAKGSRQASRQEGRCVRSLGQGYLARGSDVECALFPLPL
jgi:hypothetical protein